MNCKERVLEFKSIRKAFPGVLALDDVSFNISRGEVHGLVGENGAGKSTLIKILCGVYQADGGTILIDGKDACIKQPLDAQRAGIQVMHQEINVVPDMTVAENIWLYNLPRKGILVNDKELNRKTRKLLETLALTHIDPKMRMGELSLADQQMTNLARIVSTKPKVILMDEPTATLTMNEANKLFKVIRKFRDMGVSIIYISHYIDEVLEICDRITVLRDGHFIDTVSSAESSSEEIIAHMVGKKLKTKRRTSEALGEEVLRVSQISTANIIKFINLNLHKKEVLGLYGLNGAGKTETLRAIAGLDPLLTGSMELFGEDISKTNHNTRMSRGIVYAKTVDPEQIDYLINVDGAGRGDVMELWCGYEKFERELIEYLDNDATFATKIYKNPPPPGSDHVPFYEKGINCVELTVNDQDLLHMPEDDYQPAVLENMKRLLPVVLKVIDMH